MRLVLNLLIGLLFGAGLMLAGMTNPAKVLAFLDIGSLRQGGWDPSLAFVMAGAIAVGGFRWVEGWRRPILADAFDLPARRDLEPRLFTGPALFGVGWGLVGFCPGPALSGLGLGLWQAGLFCAAMLIGMGAARWLAARPVVTRPAPTIG